MNYEIVLSEFFKYLKGKISFQELEEILFQLKVEIEDFDEENDVAFVEITQDRPDLLSVAGLANLVNNFKWNDKPRVHFDVKKDGNKEYIINANKNIASIRPYINGAIVKNVLITDQVLREIMNFQERIHKTFGRDRKKISIGLYRFPLINFPLYYEAKKPEDINFEPLGFNRVMSANMILDEHPTGKKYAHLLEAFDRYPIFYDSSKNVLSMPPIINSNYLGALEPDEEIPQDVFIEVTGTDERTVQKCLAIIVTDLLLRGGEAYEVTSVYESDGRSVKAPVLDPEVMTVRKSMLQEYMGIKMSDAEIVKLLNKIGYIVKKIDAKEFIAETLPNRYDIMHEVDVIEDIIISYGLQNLKPEIPKLLTSGRQQPHVKFKGIFRDFYSNLGYVEVLNYMLFDGDALSVKMNAENIEFYRLKNSKLSQFNSIRPMLAPCILDYLSYNIKNEYP
ncbi:MAG: phenylalanine--tRNA ligase subunit beta, partial [Promethearchaeota archaeon]